MSKQKGVKRVSRASIRGKDFIDWDLPVEMDLDGILRNMTSKHPRIALNRAPEIQIHLKDGSIMRVEQGFEEMRIYITKNPTTKTELHITNFRNDFEGDSDALQVMHGHFRFGDDYKVMVNSNSINTEGKEEE